MSVDQALTFEITADGSSAESEIQALTVRLDALEAAWQRSSSGATVASDGIAKVAIVSKDASSGLEAIAGHAGTAGRAFSAVGASAANAAVRVEGLIGVMKEMSTAVPELVAIGAAIAVVSSAFNAMKDGVKNAEVFQSTMETLRAAVEAQGASWDNLKGKIKSFIATESEASGFTENELLGSLNDLVTAGTSVADSMQVVGVAEEAAIAHHKTLTEVTQLLIQAEAGRGMGLARLDPKLKEMIADHAKLSDVLKELHRDNEKQISDGSSLERAQARTNAAWQAATEVLGSNMIPVLTGLEEVLIGVIHVVMEARTAFYDMQQAVMDSAGVVAHGSALIWDAIRGNIGGVKAEFGALKSAGLDAAHQIAGAFSHAGAAMQTLFGGTSYAHQQVNEATYLHNQRLSHISLENDPTTGLTRVGSHHAAHHSAGHHAGHASSAHAAAQAQRELNAEIQNSLKYLEDLRAKNQLTDAQYITGLKHIESEYKLSQSQRTAIDKQVAALEKDEAKQRLDLMKKHLDALKSHDDAVITEVKNTAGQHSKAYIDALQKEINELTVWLAANKDATQKMVDDIKVKISERQAEIKAENDYELKQEQKLTDQMQAENQKRLDHLSQFTDKAMSFLDSFFNKGKKGTMDLSKAFEDMIHTMEQALEKSALMSLLGKLFGIPTASFGSMFASNLQSGFGLSGLLGGGGGAGSSLYTVGGALSSTGGWGELIGMPGAAATSALNVNVAGASSGSGLSSLFGGGGGAISPFGALAIGAGIGGMIGGMEGVGSGAQGMHQLWGGVGATAGVLGAGALFSGMGGLAGLLAAGPAGWGVLLGGAVLGGLVGGAFGPNWGPASNYPDRSDTSNYGQFVTDWTGTSGSFNGQTINPLKQYAGKSNDESQQFVTWALANPNDPLAKQLLALGNSQSQLDITNEHNGMFTLGDGKQISVTDLENMVNQWQQQTGGKMAIPTFSLTHSFPDWQNPQLALGGDFSGGSGTVVSPGGPGGPSRIPGPGQIGAPPVGGGSTTHPQPPTIHVRVELTTGALVGVTKDALVKAVSEEVADKVRRIPLTRYQTTF